MVADSFNSRVLVFHLPLTAGQNADVVLGQTDFTSSTQQTTSSGLKFPAKAIADPNGNIWVSDTFNNRVLEFVKPLVNGMAASVVLGQRDFTSADLALPTQTNLEDPFGLAFDGNGNLWVVDGSARVLEFTPPFTNGMAASLVLGQPSFTAFAKATTASGLSYPTELSFDSAGNLWLVDQGNNRVLEYKPPFVSGEAASLVLGQTDFASQVAGSSAAGLNNPYGVACDSAGNVWVADYGNKRVLEFSPPISSGQAANMMLGPEWFLAPEGIAFGPDGTVFAANTSDNQVVSFAPPFASTTNSTIVIGQTNALPSTTASGVSGPISVSTY